MLQIKKAAAILLATLFGVLLCACGSSKDAAAIEGRWKTSVDIADEIEAAEEFYIDFYYEFNEDRTYSFKFDADKAEQELAELLTAQIWESLSDMQKLGLSEEEIAEAYQTTMGETIEESVEASLKLALAAWEDSDSAGVYRVRDGKLYLQKEDAEEWEYMLYELNDGLLTIHEIDANNNSYDFVYERVKSEE